MMEFIRSYVGKRFFDGQLPALIKALERIADALEKKEEKEEQICEWEFGGFNDQWKPSCKSHSMNVYGLTWFKVCPYCGNKMKLK